MLGCSTTVTVCPNCEHEFTCCAPVPRPPHNALPPAAEIDKETVISRLQFSYETLCKSGWYYGDISRELGEKFLKNTAVGTFLLRDSADPLYTFSVGVQTEKGPRSVRICYENSVFRLDAEAHLRATMPTFPSVIDLLQHYVRRKKVAQVWVDQKGKCLSPLVLTKPLRKDAKIPDLKHLARLAINRRLNVEPTKPIQICKLGLPVALSKYLVEYPFSI